MARLDDDRLREVAGLCAVALGAARSALSGAAEVLAGSDDMDRMKASDAALHELRATIEMLVPDGTVPTGVRAAVAVAHVEGDMVRVAELAQQVAEIAWSWRERAAVVPPAVRSALTALSGTAVAVVGHAREAVGLAGPGRRAAPVSVVEAAAGLDGQLAAVAGSVRSLDGVLAREDPRIDVPEAVDVALLGRCYESCAWHAVTAVRHVARLTG